VVEDRVVKPHREDARGSVVLAAADARFLVRRVHIANVLSIPRNVHKVSVESDDVGGGGGGQPLAHVHLKGEIRRRAAVPVPHAKAGGVASEDWGERGARAALTESSG
jgi:hypothetical protein